MADRGVGIRLFNSKLSLQKIFEDFEESSDDTDEEGENEDETVITSQLRHFVIQEYLSTPLLLNQVKLSGPSGVESSPQDESSLQGHKFHLRAYCVASGALTVYLYSRVLALFSALPYSLPGVVTPVDMTPHLTNTSRQPHLGDDCVRLLDELVGSQILAHTRCPDGTTKGLPVLTAEDVTSIMDQIADILADVFKAALETPVHFQPLPNAFELFGVDFMVVHVPVAPDEPPQRPSFQVKVLEFNAEPAIEFTGARLTWILEDLFIAIGKACVKPFFAKEGTRNEESDSSSWPVGDTRFGLIKCLETRDPRGGLERMKPL